MIDVTDFVLEGSEDYIYRVPTTDVNLGDLVVTSDAPFGTLFVQAVQEEGGIQGIDPRTNRIQTYVQPTNILNLTFFVKVISVSDLFRRRDDDDLSAVMAWIMLSGSGGGGQGLSLDNPLAAVLLLLSHDRDHDDILPLLIAMSGAQGAQDNSLPLILLASSFRGSGFFHEIEEPERRAGREERGRRGDREGERRADELRLELAAEHARRLQVQEDLAALFAQMRQGQTTAPRAADQPEVHPGAADQPEAHPARRARPQTPEST
jgi:hypothetical protein